jgi:histidine ammonia-lyase
MVLTMIGEGEAEYKGEIMPGKKAMEKAGIPIIRLEAKEGLALINGTQIMTAIGVNVLWDAMNLLKVFRYRRSDDQERH